MALADDVEREPWRAAGLHQLGDLMPADLAGEVLGQRPREPQPGELPHPPVVH